MSNIDLENEVIILSLDTIDKLFKIEHGTDAVSLYLFYHKQSKLQKTNQSWSLGNFCKKGLGWGDDRFRRAKKILKELGLIEDIQIRNENGTIKTTYIRIKYMKSQQQANLSSSTENPAVDFPSTGLQETNALSSLTGNALSSLTRKEKIYKKDFIVSNKEKLFNDFYSLYPNKVSKEKAKLAFEKALKKVSFEKLMEGLDNYLKDIQKKGTQKQYIKHPTTWLNGGCWDDDYGEILTFDGLLKDYDKLYNDITGSKEYKLKYGPEIRQATKDYLNTGMPEKKEMYKNKLLEIIKQKGN